jgi:hypothetical protein
MSFTSTIHDSAAWGTLALIYGAFSERGLEIITYHRTAVLPRTGLSPSMAVEGYLIDDSILDSASVSTDITKSGFATICA